MSYPLARSEASGPHHAFDEDHECLLCRSPGPFTLYPGQYFNPAHAYACAECGARSDSTGDGHARRLAPHERVEITLAGEDDDPQKMVVRQHETSPGPFVDPPFNKQRSTTHVLHIDITEQADATEARRLFAVGNDVSIVGTVVLPTLTVKDVAEPATIRVDGKKVSRLAVSLCAKKG